MRSYKTYGESSTSSIGGISFGGALALIFIVLKLVGVIDWSWVWVLSPIWIGWIFVLVIYIVITIIAYITTR